MAQAAALDPANDDVEQHRSTLRVDLEVEVRFYDHTNFYVGFSENISEGGLFVATYNMRPIGKAVAMTLMLPDGSEIQVHGVVRWHRQPRDADSDVPPGFGVQFDDLSDEARDAITNFQRFNESIFYPD